MSDLTDSIKRTIIQSQAAPRLLPGEANIVAQSHVEQVGHYLRWHYHTFTWLGPRTGRVRLPRDFDVSQLPWPLLRVDTDVVMDRHIYVRADGLSLIPAVWTALRCAAHRYWLPIRCRLIITAAVWGLAYMPYGAEPSWRDLGKKRP